MSTNDPEDPKKVNLVQQAEEGAENTSDCCGESGGGSNDDCCGDGGDDGGDDCCGG